jgi:preprotein translocase subunit SecF
MAALAPAEGIANLTMRPIRLINKVPKLDFFRFHKLCFALSIALCVISVVSVAVRGLNFGVDFAGGIIVEVRTQQPADLAAMRSTLGALNLGDIALQEFGSDRDVLIRVERQMDEVAEEAAVQKIREALGSNVEYRRGELVAFGRWCCRWAAFSLIWRSVSAGALACPA